MDLSGLAELACKSLQPIAVPKHIVIVQRTCNTDARPAVSGVRNDILRLLTNIISNAIKFTPPHGEVVVSTGFSADRSAATIVVADNGIGIAPEKLPLLFDRFSGLSQLGTAGELSTGLGMAIVKEIVERHTGQIAVTSQPGKGTVITVTLPVRT